MMIRVKVNSKSKLVEDREGKSTLYGVICCCDDKLLTRVVIWNHTVKHQVNCCKSSSSGK